MKALSVLFLANLALVQISHASGLVEVADVELIATGTLPPIHKLEFVRGGGGEKNFEITAHDEGYQIFLKTYRSVAINKYYIVPTGDYLALKLDKLFNQNNDYEHFSNYHNNQTGTWRSWQFYDDTNSSLLTIADQEYVLGLDLNEIEYLVQIIVKDDLLLTDG